MRQVFFGSLLAAAVISAPAVVGTQSTTPFTAEDMPRVASISVLDVTEDGGCDHHRGPSGSWGLQASGFRLRASGFGASGFGVSGFRASGFRA